MIMRPIHVYSAVKPVYNDRLMGYFPAFTGHLDEL